MVRSLAFQAEESSSILGIATNFTNGGEMKKETISKLKDFKSLILWGILVIAIIFLCLYFYNDRINRDLPYNMETYFHVNETQAKDLNNITVEQIFDKNTGVYYYIFINAETGGVSVSPVYNTDGSIKVVDGGNPSND